MNLLMILFLSGLAMKVFASIIGWIGEVMTHAFSPSLPESNRSSELGAMGTVDYFRIRPGSDPKLRKLAGDGETPPSLKKSA